jgi:hypothetical protein
MTLDKRFLEDVARALPERPRRDPPETGQKSGLKGAAGFGYETEPESADAAAGIASPLVEPDESTREYYSDIVIVSSDGLFTLAIQPIKRLHMQDANGAAVVLEFDKPSN